MDVAWRWLSSARRDAVGGAGGGQKMQSGFI